MKRLLMVTIFISSLLLADSPSRVLLNLTENPASEIAVTWRNYDKIKNPRVQILPADASTKMDPKASTFSAGTEILKINELEIYQHGLIVDQLKPGTTYAYRVGTEDSWSEWNHFTTACKEPVPFQFVYLGDVQNGIFDMSSRVLRSAYRRAPNAGFWLYAGDIVNHGDNDHEWGEIFDALGWISRTTPMVFLPGNHEYPRIENSRILTPLWRPQMTQPENGPEGLEESAFYIDYQGLRLITLNGNEKLEEQVRWLDKVLSENKQFWTIISIHQPFYSTAQGRDSKDRRDLFLPIIDKYSVDLVLQGHDHTYGRTYKLRGGNIVPSHEPGTYYAVSVVGVKVYDMKEENMKFMAKMGNGRQLFQVIGLDGNVLTYRSYDATGAVYDSFEIIK
ncbi:MAG: metallophosphoesterase family protein [Candidatus Marinimicrobia bacterium]|nr:metallophosphoesterase family protein [Candidatus Neomarinimicrobiota bacterium]